MCLSISSQLWCSSSNTCLPQESGIHISLPCFLQLDMPDLDELSIICALEQLRWSVYMSRAVVLQIFELVHLVQKCGRCKWTFQGFEGVCISVTRGLCSRHGRHASQHHVSTTCSANMLYARHKNIGESQVRTCGCRMPMIWPGLVLQCIMIATDLILTMMRIAASCMHGVRSSNAVNAQPHQCFAQISWCSHNLTSCLRALHQENGKATLILYATTCAGCVVH